MYSIVIGSLAALLYLLTGGLLGRRLSRSGNEVGEGKATLVMLGASAVLLHAIILFGLLLHPDGFNLGFFNALSLTGWLCAAFLLVLALVRPVENLGIVLLPFSAVTVVLGVVFPSQRIVSSAVAWPLKIHIVISVAAYALLALAVVQALLLAVQERRLRGHHPGGFLRGLPPVTTMEALLFQLIGAGFLLLSFALLSGLLFLEDIFAQHLVHKTTLSILAWLLFGVLLWGRWRQGWRGKTAVRWTLGGFVALVLAYFGSELVLQLILQRR